MGESRGRQRREVTAAGTTVLRFRRRPKRLTFTLGRGGHRRVSARGHVTALTVWNNRAWHQVEDRCSVHKGGGSETGQKAPVTIQA